MRKLTAQAHQLFLNDLLHLVQHSPERAASWHRLYVALSQTPTDRRSAYLERIQPYFIASGLVGIHAHTFAHAFTGDTAHLAQAGRCWIEKDLPLDAGMALLSTAFASGMQTKQQGGLVAYLSSSGVVPLIKAMSNKATREILGTPTIERKKPQAVQRVAIFAPMISQPLHAPTRMVKDHAALLAGAGVETRIFSPQDMLMHDMPQWLGAPHSIRIGAPTQENLTFFGAVPVELAPLQFGMRLRWRWLLERMMHFNPDAVLLIGNFSPVLDAIHQLFPVIGMGVNAMPPLANLDVWLAPTDEQAKSWLPDFSYQRHFLHSQRFALPTQVAKCDRSSLNLPLDGVIWVTTGTRLSAELDTTFVQQILKQLDACPNAYWLLIGLDEESQKRFKQLHQRIITQPYQENLHDWLGASTIYLNPPRIGGGFSILMAMSLPIAVVSLNYGDGGEKLGTLAQPNLTKYLDLLDQLTNDPVTYKAHVSMVLKRSEQMLIKNSDTLLSALKSLI